MSLTRRLAFPSPDGLLPLILSADTSNLDWIDPFLTKFRCPDTRQALRWATPEECARAGIPPAPRAALARADGSRVFAIEDGIPILLPLDSAQD